MIMTMKACTRAAAVSELDWIWGVRDSKESRITPRFQVGSTGKTVVPSTVVGKARGRGDSEGKKVSSVLDMLSLICLLDS